MPVGGQGSCTWVPSWGGHQLEHFQWMKMIIWANRPLVSSMGQELLELPSSIRVSLTAIAFFFFFFSLKCLQNVEKCSRSRKTGTVQCNYSEHPPCTDRPTILNLESCLTNTANSIEEQEKVSFLVTVILLKEKPELKHKLNLRWAWYMVHENCGDL